MQEEKRIDIAEGQLTYARLGSGKKKLLAFHGFGQTKEIFEPWEKEIGKTYTIFAFDLFYHGHSTRVSRSLGKEEWKLFIKTFLKKEEIERFEVLGYSLGGRFAIATSFLFHKQVEHLTLIAPDGIYLTTWFKLATYPVLKTMLKGVMLHPNLLDRLLSINDRIPLINSYVSQFIRKELGTLENRKRVYISWNYFKSLGYSKKQLAQGFHEANFFKTLILGDKDRVLPPSALLALVEKMGPFRVHCLPMKHHQLIRPEVANLVGK